MIQLCKSSNVSAENRLGFPWEIGGTRVSNFYWQERKEERCSGGSHLLGIMGKDTLLVGFGRRIRRWVGASFF